MTTATPNPLFPTRFMFVCNKCELAYKAGRYAGWGTDHALWCAKCLVGADPDDDPTTSQETPPCSTTTRPVSEDTAPSLFDDTDPPPPRPARSDAAPPATSPSTQR